MDFAAIDFETANYKSDSPCQVAVVVVESGQIVAEQSWLIRPRRMYFSSQCIAIHGIQPADVQDQPEWPEIWRQLIPLLDGKTVVAHNASFDLRVLTSTLLLYDLPCIDLDYTCTRLIGRRTWPGMSGYGLKAIANSLGITFQHHDALEDSRTCAKILLQAARKIEVATLDALEDTLALVRGRVRYGNLQGPRSLKRSTNVESGEGPSRNVYGRTGFPDRATRIRQRRSAVETLAKGCETTQPLDGKNVVLQGSLLGLKRDDAINFLVRLGATVQKHINLQTDFLIVGHSQDEPDANTNANSNLNSDVNSKLESEVEKRKADGQPIRTLSQRQLLALIPGGTSMARALAGESR
jgi:DNA polymerase III subunit epsilon